MTRGFPKPGGRHGDDGLKIGRTGMEPVFNFIDRSVKDEKPFFVWYAPFLPHTPHTPPARLFEKYKAKAVIDMFIYRFAKAAIAIDIIGLQAAIVVTAVKINYIVVALIVIWIIIVPILIREYNKRKISE